MTPIDGKAAIGGKPKRNSDEFQRVVISGYCTSEGRFFYHLRCVIATVTKNEVKVWPQDDVGNGKLWFDAFHCRVKLQHA